MDKLTRYEKIAFLGEGQVRVCLNNNNYDHQLVIIKRNVVNNDSER